MGATLNLKSNVSPKNTPTVSSKGEAIHSERKRETKKERKRERERGRDSGTVLPIVVLPAALLSTGSVIWSTARLGCLRIAAGGDHLSHFISGPRPSEIIYHLIKHPREGRRSNEQQEAAHNDDGTETSPMATNQYGMFSGGVTLPSPGW